MSHGADAVVYTFVEEEAPDRDCVGDACVG